MFRLKDLVRKNILELLPYSSARNEFSGVANIWLDANENPFNTELNRYPDPNQTELKNRISAVKGINPRHIFIGNGSDEAIDLLFRAFCEPGQDKAYVFPPTYGMYEVSAKINNIETVQIPLEEYFTLPPIRKIRASIESKGLLFICSPNNPTGNTLSLERIKEIADDFKGIVVVDEAYVDFANSISALTLIESTPNIVVLQTMSKAYGLAGLRLGMAYAHTEIIDVLNRVKPPYNINTLSQLKGIEALEDIEKVKEQIAQIVGQREELITALAKVDCVKNIYPSEANFILAEFENANNIYSILRAKGIVIRNRTSQVRDALRITVGTANENIDLVKALNKI